VKHFRIDSIDLVAIVGFAVLILGVSIGSAMVFVPAGFIAAGLLLGGGLLLYAISASRGET
jgi:hypothetical protein